VTFQQVIEALNKFWSRRGCLLWQPYDIEKGAELAQTYDMPGSAPQGGREKDKKFSTAYSYPKNVFAPVGGCGFGFVWTSLECLREIAKNGEFDPFSGWFADKRDFGGFGEDLNFCYLALRSNVQLYAHTGVQVGHSGDPLIITEDTYKTSKEKVGNVVVQPQEERVKWGR
jgi:hypothetical protein